MTDEVMPEGRADTGSHSEVVVRLVLRAEPAARTATRAGPDTPCEAGTAAPQPAVAVDKTFSCLCAALMVADG